MTIKVWNSEQDQRTYRALQKWAERLNRWEFSKQFKKNNCKPLKHYSPNAFSLILIEASGKLLDNEISAEEAMSLLHTVEGKTELRLCMEAGF